MSSQSSIFIENKASVLFVTIFTLLLSFSSQARLYKWVGENGETRYGDQLPANFTNKKHFQLDSEGRIILTKEAGKSPQRALAEKEAGDKKAAEIAAEKQRIKQNRADRVLLLTFNSESDIFYSRDQRLQVLDSKISLLNKNKELSEKKLINLKKQAQEQYLSKDLAVPGGLQQKLEEMNKKIEITVNSTNRTLHKRVEVVDEFKNDLKRFRDLKERQRKNKNEHN